MKQSDVDDILERLWGVQAFLEEFIPALLEAHPHREQLEELLDGMAQMETSPADAEVHWQAEIAERILFRLRPS